MNSRLVVSLAASLGLAILAAPTAQASLLDSGTAVDRSERVTLADSDVSQVEASWQGLPDAADAVTASGSGLDPDISVAYADLQVPRVAEANGLSEAKVRELVDDNSSGRTWGTLGEPRVDVLMLNIAVQEAAAGG